MNDNCQSKAGLLPILEALEGRVSSELLEDLQTLFSETIRERRAIRAECEQVKHEREVLRTALLGFFDLASEGEIRPFLKQSLELAAHLAGAEVGAISLLPPGEQTTEAPYLITRHCTEADLAFIQEELYHREGILRQARDANQTIRLPDATNSDRLLQNLRQRHVKAAIAIPFLAPEHGSVRGLLYLEHMSRKNAFEGDLAVLLECLKYISSRLFSAERLDAYRYLTDHTAPFRQCGRYHHLAGRSPFLRNLLHTLELFHQTRLDAPVLLVGEDGSGRETLASTIHRISGRAERPFRSVLCEDLPEEELEVMLFGDPEQEYALSSSEFSRGLFEQCEGGTVYLENVESLSPALQARIFRTLVERRYCRTRSEVTVHFDVRVISSSRMRLRDPSLEDQFRTDLAERLSLFEVYVEPLRRRREDILPLAEHFLARACKKSGRHDLIFTPAALFELERQPWPGNLSELARTIEAAVSICPGKLIDVGHLFANQVHRENDVDAGNVIQSWKVEQNEFQRRLIRAAMEKANRNVTKAAKFLNISRQYLNNRIRMLDIDDLRSNTDEDE